MSFEIGARLTLNSDIAVFERGIWLVEHAFAICSCHGVMTLPYSPKIINACRISFFIMIWMLCFNLSRVVVGKKERFRDTALPSEPLFCSAFIR